MTVLRYKMELQEQKMINAEIDKKIQEVGQETTTMFQELSHDEIS